jgi:hypothetical protein
VRPSDCARSATRQRGLLLLLAALFLLEKCVSSWWFIGPDARLQDLQFGFGAYVRSLVANGSFAACVGERCNHASRMPVIPLFCALVAHFSHRQLVAALLKNALLSCGLLGVVRILESRSPTQGPLLRRSFILVLGVMALCPAVIKHASMITYEEGFILEPLLVWIACVVVSAQLLASRATAEAAPWIAVAILIALFVFMTKSSMVLVLTLSFALGLGALGLAGRSLHGLAPVALALLACSVVVGCWGLRQQREVGRFSIMSTWDGENLYRGNNPVAPEIYPRLSLDQLFDSRSVVLADGRVLRLAPQPGWLGYASERAWDQAYRARAIHWMTAHKRAALGFLLRKAENFFCSIHETPAIRGSGAHAPDRGWKARIEHATITLWLVFGRAMELLLAYRLRAELRVRDPRRAWRAGSMLAALAAYSAPYVVGFNYERHITPFLLMVLMCVAMLQVRVSPPAPG